MADYETHFREGAVKKGVKRGMLDWTEYQHEFEAAREKERCGRNVVVEEQLFVSAMQPCRMTESGHTMKASKHWLELSNDPAVERDMEGPPESTLLSLACKAFVSLRPCILTLIPPCGVFVYCCLCSYQS